MGTQKQEGRTLCLFCRTNKNISHEHVLPNWLRNVIRDPREFIPHVSTDIHTDFVNRTMAFQPSFQFRQGAPGNRTLRRVCKGCNTGWMKRLQDELKPILIPLIKGDWSAFDPHRAERIAVWATMTAMVIAASYKHGGVLQEERTHLWKHRTVPANWMVWVGRGSGFEGIGYHNRVFYIGPGSAEDIINPRKTGNGAVTTIPLGQLLLHTINAPHPDILTAPALYGASLGVFPIHPWGGDQLDWRSIPFISGASAEFRELADRFFHELPVGITL